MHFSHPDLSEKPGDHFCRKLFSNVAFIAALALGAPACGASVAPVTRVVAISGDSPARGQGVLSELEIPVLHDSGHAAFVGVMRNAGVLVGSGVFRGDGSSRTVDVIALKGDPTPDINGNFDTFSQVRINRLGEVAFGTMLSGTLGGALDRAAYFRADGSIDGLVQLARGNQAAPEGNGRFDISQPTPFSFNGAGQAVFTFPLRNAPTAGAAGVYRSDGTNSAKIARTGDLAPESQGTFTISRAPTAPAAINQSGQVLFLADVLADHTSGFYRGDGENVLALARRGDSVPDADGNFGFFVVRGAFNDRGEVAFADPLLQNTVLGLADNGGVFRGDKNTVVPIARKGALAPNNNGRYLEFNPDVALNNAGQVLFAATLSGAAGGASSGLFLGDDSTTIPVALANDPAPGGGRFSGFHDPRAPLTMLALNNSGQVAFYADIDLENGGAVNDTFGLFFYDPVEGLFAVARENDPLGAAGSITRIDFAGGLSSVGDEGSGFNNHGQVAYKAFAGGDAVIAIWSLQDAGDNLPPVVTNVEVQTSMGRMLQFSVSSLLNAASDPEGGSIALASFAAASIQGGTVTRVGDDLHYTPPSDYVGPDEFTFIVRDDIGLTATGKVLVTVHEFNQPPVIDPGAGPFTAAVRLGDVLVIPVADLLERVTDPDGDPLSLGPLPQTTLRGAVIAQSDSTISLTWGDAALSSFTQVASDQFDYIVQDGRGGSVTVRAEISPAGGLGIPRVIESRGASGGVAEVTFTLTESSGLWTIQRAETILGPWTNLTSITFRGRGEEIVQFSDTQPPPTRAFYRAASDATSGGR